MKKNTVGILSLLLLSGMVLSGCGASANETASDAAGTSVVTAENSGNVESEAETSADESSEAETDSVQTASELTVRFGAGGEPYTLHLYENDTAAAIAGYVGTSNWNLPIYHYDDYENWEVMQYYDIPNRYEIPSAPEQITEEAAGTVYYSEPNRIILFYQEAEVPAEYTPVGYFDYTEEFLQAVQDNPVLEGWGNKIIQISDGE